MNALVEEHNYTSVVCNDKKENLVYYIVEWIGVPWTDQQTCQFMCDTAAYWSSIPQSSILFWYNTRSSPLCIETHALTHMVTADLPPLHVMVVQKTLLQEKVQRKKLVLNHMILSLQKYLGELKMLTVQTKQIVLVMLLVVIVVE